MASVKVEPGASARRAFRLGLVAATVLACAVLGLLYWLGVVSLVSAGSVLALLLPVYLVLVASVLGVWLGYDRDVSDLRPVRRERELP